MTRHRFRRIISRAKIEAIVDAQRQAKDCEVCAAICPYRVPYSIDAIVDTDRTDRGVYCSWAADGWRMPTFH